VQQARGEALARVTDIYAGARVAAEVAPFFADLPARIASSHMVVARSGASTVAELAAIGRPAILVPLPHALDQDQSANAGVLERAGGAMRLRQDDFTPDRLAGGKPAAPGRPHKRLAKSPAAAKARSNGRGRPLAGRHRRRRAAGGFGVARGSNAMRLHPGAPNPGHRRGTRA